MGRYLFGWEKSAMTKIIQYKGKRDKASYHGGIWSDFTAWDKYYLRGVEALYNITILSLCSSFWFWAFKDSTFFKYSHFSLHPKHRRLWLIFWSKNQSLVVNNLNVCAPSEGIGFSYNLFSIYFFVFKLIHNLFFSC